jgi:hypothetical protein
MNIEQNMTDGMEKHRSKIEGTKAVIENLQQQQNDLYDRLIEDINPSEEQEPWLWNYVFNASNNDNTEYNQMVERGIYGDQ